MSKTILVTGGNRGIGLGICTQLAAKGHKVLLGARDLVKGRKAASGIDGEVCPIKLDVTEAEFMSAVRDNIQKDHGQLDVLINNAGIGVGNKGAAQPDMDEVRQIMETNFFAVWNLSKTLLPLLKQSSDGRIVNMSSGMGALADLKGGYAGYRLSKTALNGLTILLAAELEGSVSVNAMCPGWVRTDMGGQEAARSVEQGADTAVWLATAPDIPSGQFFRDRKQISW